jgi:hypothetical protein
VDINRRNIRHLASDHARRAFREVDGIKFRFDFRNQSFTTPFLPLLLLVWQILGFIWLSYYGEKPSNSHMRFERQNAAYAKWIGHFHAIA